MKALAATIGLVLLATIAMGTVWGASEAHYRACLERNVIVATARDNDDDPLRDWDFTDRDDQVSVAGCDRWPF